MVIGIVLPLAAALLQGSVVPFVDVAGARPNLVVLVAASWSVAAGAREAVWWAFFGGLLADLLSGGPLGALALASLVPVAAVGLSDDVLATIAAEPRSKVTFEIEPVGEKVRLTVVHDGFEPGSTVFTMISEGWPELLSDLKTLLEAGAATR